ncbi:MAG: FMN-binding protein [Rikenellaceae bacterium]
MVFDRIKNIVNVLIIVILLTGVSINRDGRVVGKNASATINNRQSGDGPSEPVDTILSDGIRVINSSSLAKDIKGFGGQTPVKLYLRDSVIQRVVFVPNTETTHFFVEVIKSGLLKRWNGLTIREASDLSVDVVSGATYSSSAIIGNVHRALEYVSGVR